MSYGVTAALQAAVFQRLVQDAALDALVGGAIHDAVPPGTPPGTFVLLGPEEAFDRADISGGGAEHRFTVSVVTDASGFLAAKAIAAAVSDALVDAPLTLMRGRLVSLGFLRATARQAAQGEVRRIDMTFRARVED
ncbi:DUF3168 domain-containing protein [Alkalilacustris brevis]|uniref:DUF3168 domain-containing protein n=1 Tax=Alkalilacustris brevis TaxID=2026338 RepID=UPI000E0D506F|nr:DUF3168 domain-containing protein [Alkalilacustris brevis]